MTSSDRSALRETLLLLLTADPDTSNRDLWLACGGSNLGVTYTTFCTRYSLAARKALNLGEHHPAKALRRTMPNGPPRPERVLPPPAKWIPPPRLRGPALSAKELARERQKSIRRQAERGGAA
jgi:hypothetical protein